MGDGWPQPVGGWPEWVWTVPYVGAHHPASGSLPTINNGANCQRYAYAVLALFELAVPPLRSSDLWEEQALTRPVAPGHLAALDLVLFNADAESWGAHVGVFMAPNQVLHLCQEVGTPAVWTWGDFAARPGYATFLGAKRVSAQTGPAPRR